MIKAKMKQLVKDKLLLFAGMLRDRGKQHSGSDTGDYTIDAINDTRSDILIEIGEMLAEFAEREL